MNNRFTIYRDFQSKCTNAVQLMSTMYSCPEFSVEKRERRTTVTVYIKGGAVSFTMFVSGRTVYEQTESVRDNAYSVLTDKLDLSYRKGECTVVDLLDKISVLFDKAIVLREAIRESRRIALKKAREKTLSDNDGLIEEKAEVKLEPPFAEILDESYLDDFDIVS